MLAIFLKSHYQPIMSFRACLLAAVVLFGATLNNHAQEEFLENKYVSILSAYPKYADAHRDAKKIAAASGTPYSSEGRVYVNNRGLIYPDNYTDDVFAGNYVARRYNTTVLPNQTNETEFLSVERSDGYPGFRPGYYIVVAGIYDSADPARKQAAKYKAWAPTGYAKKTKIFMGCLH